jgi:hypothetical protein
MPFPRDLNRSRREADNLERSVTNPMETADRDRLDAAFELLRDVVGEHFERGRLCHAAGLKPAMQAKAPDFHESRLGFSSFREFLRVAEVQGVVKVQAAPTGPDVVVLPMSATSDPRAADSLLDQHGSFRIRGDLWRAFFDWTPGFIRVYDRANDEAVVLPAKPNPFQTAEQNQLREELEQQPDRFVSIDPIDINVQLGWMNEFVAELSDPGLQQIFGVALASDRPIAGFTRAVRTDPRLARMWQRRRVEKVRAEIEQWSEAHGLDIRTEERPEAPKPTPSVPERERDLDEGSGEVAALRDRLHTAIDRMTYGDLLRLPIPVEYILRQD